MKRALKEFIKKKLNIGQDKKNFYIRIISGKEKMYVHSRDNQRGWYLVDYHNREYFDYFTAVDLSSDIQHYFDDENMVIDILERGVGR